MRSWWSTVQDAASAEVMMKEEEKAIQKEVSAGLVPDHAVAAIQEKDQHHHLVKERESGAERAQGHHGINEILDLLRRIEVIYRNLMDRFLILRHVASFFDNGYFLPEL